MQVGIAIVLAGLVVFAGRAIIESQVTDSLVKVEANKPAGRSRDLDRDRRCCLKSPARS